MKVKNLQLQALQRAILDNRRIQFDGLTAFHIAQISSKISQPVLDFENVMRDIAQKHIIENEKWEKIVDQEKFLQEARPVMEEEVDVALPDKITIKISKNMKLTPDFFTVFMSIYWDNLVVIEENE